MARSRTPSSSNLPDAAISVIGTGMTIVGNCETDGTVRIEGKVEGTVRAGKAVVIGKEGCIVGNIFTQDAVVSGRVKGTVFAESRLELQSTSDIDGDIKARRMLLEDGALINGQVEMGDIGASRPTEKGGPPKGQTAKSPVQSGRG